MPATQMQEYCPECDRPTLHTRQVEGPNHIVHCLLTLFLCGFWLPIWILLAMFPEKHPWHCTQCGHQPGQPTTRDLERMARQRQIRAHEVAERRAERMARLREGSAVAVGATKVGALTALKHIGATVRTSLGAADRALAKMATGDDFTHWLFRFVFGAIGVGAFAGVLIVAWRAAFG